MTTQTTNYSSASLGSAQRTSDLVNTASKMLAQTSAQGTKAFKGSSYDTPNPVLTPVITSSAAKDDLAKKQADFATLQANNATHASTLAQQKLLDQQAQMEKDRQAQEQKNIQAGIDQKAKETEAKNAALGIVTPPPTSSTVTPQPQNAPVVSSAPTSSSTGTIAPQGAIVDPQSTQGKVATINNSLNDSTGTLVQGLDDIQNTKDSLATTVNKQLNSVLRGTFPLTTSQQALVTSVQNQLVQQENEQKIANKGYEGAVAQAGFREGGEYTPAQYAGQIANAVSYGVAKIQALDNAAAKTMAELDTNFQKDDYDMITKNYALLDKQLDDKSSHLKDMFDAVTSTLKDQRDQQLKAQETIAKNEKDAKDFTEKVREFNTNHNLEAAKYNHQLEMDASTGTNSLDDKGLEMLARGYLTSGVMPSVGYGKQAVAMRTAIINKAVKLSGGADNVNPAVNKAAYDANKAVLKNQQQSYTVADTAYRIFDKNGDLALTLAKGLNNSNSPIINQLSNSVINQTTGQGQLDSYKAVVTSLQSEYATLINVKGGGGGQVTEGDKTKAEKAIPMDISPARLQEVLTNLKKEGTNVLNERKQTVDQLTSNITNNGTAYNTKVADKPLLGQITTAKSLGYSPSEIILNLTKNPQYSSAISSAKAQGYNDDEIINYLTQ